MRKSQAALMMSKKKLNKLKKSIKLHNNKIFQFLLIFVYHPWGLVALPSFEFSCQDCKNQLLLWKCTLHRKKWISEEYKVNNDKRKCYDFVVLIKSRESPLKIHLEE